MFMSKACSHIRGGLASFESLVSGQYMMVRNQEMNRVIWLCSCVRKSITMKTLDLGRSDTLG